MPENYKSRGGLKTAPTFNRPSSTAYALGTGGSREGSDIAASVTVDSEPDVREPSPHVSTAARCR